MRLWYGNLVDASGVGITSLTSDANLPPANVAHEHKTKVWRTGVTSALETITFDLGAAQSVTGAMIFAHTLLGTDTAIELRGSNAGFPSGDTFIASFTWSAGPMLVTFAAVSMRYWRVKFTKPTAGVTRDIGRIFLGNPLTSTARPDYDGWKPELADLSIRSRSIGGQYYSDQRPSYRTSGLDFSAITQTERDQFAAFAQSVGLAKSFWCQVDETGTGEVAEVVYCKLSKMPKFRVSGFDTSLRYDTTLEMEEQL